MQRGKWMPFYQVGETVLTLREETEMAGFEGRTGIAEFFESPLDERKNVGKRRRNEQVGDAGQVGDTTPFDVIASRLDIPVQGFNKWSFPVGVGGHIRFSEIRHHGQRFVTIFAPIEEQVGAIAMAVGQRHVLKEIVLPPFHFGEESAQGRRRNIGSGDDDTAFDPERELTVPVFFQPIREQRGAKLAIGTDLARERNQPRVGEDGGEHRVENRFLLSQRGTPGMRKERPMHRKRASEKSDGTEQNIQMDAAFLPIGAVDNEGNMPHLHQDGSQERDPEANKHGRGDLRMTEPPPKFLSTTFDLPCAGQCSGQGIEMERRAFEQQSDHGTECPEIARIETNTKLK